jgi:hypothetical protein
MGERSILSVLRIPFETMKNRVPPHLRRERRIVTAFDYPAVPTLGFTMILQYKDEKSGEPLTCLDIPIPILVAQSMGNSGNNCVVMIPHEIFSSPWPLCLSEIEILFRKTLDIPSLLVLSYGFSVDNCEKEICAMSH